jgi:Bacterial lipid A biosynthesis acyltransferase
MTIRDVRDIVRLVPLALIACLLPPRFWRKAAKAISHTGGTRGHSSTYQRILERKYSKSEIANISARHRAYLKELKLQILGLSGPWRSWHPNVHLNGAVHLREALARGHGAILWVTATAFSTLVAKMALHDAGYRACQLSRPVHGFSTSKFGVRFLNPLWTTVEDRYIAERVLIFGEYAAEALATLRARLSANRVVIITVGAEAHKFSQVPFFDTQLGLPTGPIRLARTTGAALLPVFSITKENGGYEVSIQEPLQSAGSQSDDESVAAAYVKRLEPFVLEYPDQWNGWQL